jgi:hypothetical protein
LGSRGAGEEAGKDADKERLGLFVCFGMVVAATGTAHQIERQRKNMKGVVMQNGPRASCRLKE